MRSRKDSGRWRKNPQIYEINVWVWLEDLSRRYGSRLTLGDVPAMEWDAIASSGFDVVWLMGVWERSPTGVKIALYNTTLLTSFRQSLADFQQDDVVGSPYCIRRYRVDRHLGGREGLARARQALFKRGLLLVLDFVPNHVAFDHHWVFEHPEYFVQGTRTHLQQFPQNFRDINGTILACGRDPNFPPWPDVLQLNAFHPGLRSAVKEALLDIAQQCDGVRCDMAMLVCNEVFAHTWEGMAGPVPQDEYWQQIIPGIKALFPHFRFIAEVYWDMEKTLHHQAFDYCYDKKLYDLLLTSDAPSLKIYLQADLSYQEKLLRFIENHDEPRAAQVFPEKKQQAAAVAALTLPGARLVHEGQMYGRSTRLNVFLGRRQDEHGQAALQIFYQKLLPVLAQALYHEGHWQLGEPRGWPDNDSFRHILAWSWDLGKDARHWIIINFSDFTVQARIPLPWPDLREQNLQLEEIFSGLTYERSGPELASQGLYAELPAWGLHFFKVEPLSK